ncbi:uncharacterized protein [Lepeophtheirus salmonis]|uniref:uncharacterized protein isoform X8 n=1 Tax=Lepeophtheirus salmonis TaxID=72036 RepID=UPI001AE9AD19|nr:uncharacterized protein LOC121127219 isoform X5 [Lepeophtheirus salmonis]
MYLKISNMFFPILQPPTFIYIFVMFLLLVRENEVNSKTSRVRTNYKLRVGEQRVGRYTPYSQVRLPSTGEYPYGEAENYYKHAKISEWYKGKRRLKSKMEIDPATQLKFEPIIEKHKKATKMSCDKISSRKNYHRKKWRCWYI